MKPSLRNYKIGFGILGLFTLVLLVMVVMQAGATKQDAKTDTAANAAADKLNDYTLSHDAVPTSLAAAGVTNTAAGAITYTKVSDTSYKFCATYKASSSDFDPSAVATDLAFGSALSGGSADTSDGIYLYIPTNHHKGANCQTIKIVSFSGSNNTSTSSDSLFGLKDKPIDTERKTDLNELQSYLEVAFATNNSYPTLAELNASGWRTTNMPGLDPAASCDPSSATTKTACSFAAIPAKDVYAYLPTTDSGQACMTSGTCTHYALEATLSDTTVTSLKDFN